jgi:hypothetical protein
MMLRIWPGCLAAGFLLSIAATSADAGSVLITPEEASLPAPKGAVAVTSRGITRGPRVEYLGGPSPAHSPIRLQLKFQSFGGATIDPDSVKVTYLKNPAVDLTPRLKPFTQPTGIDMADAVLPAGDHMLRVDLKDSDGRSASTSFTLKIAP